MAVQDSRDSFQPEKPHHQTKGSGGSKRTPYIIAAASAAMVIMILAIMAPRFLGTGAARWGLTLGIGVVTFVLVLFAGRIGGGS